MWGRAADRRLTSVARGSVLFLTFLVMLILSGLALAVGVFSNNSVVAGRDRLLDQQAFYIAEAGWQRARQALNASTWSAAASPGNTYTESFGAGEYAVTIVDNGDSTYTITSDGYVPNQALAVARRRVVEASLPVSGGGTNLSLGATASASSSQSGHAATLSNDNNATTFWRANTQGSGEWLRMDYGSATTVSQIVILEEQWITGLSAVQYSSDGSSWSSVPSLSVTEAGTTWTADFTATSARYFRVTFTASGSTRRVGVFEFSSYAPFSLGTGAFRTQW